MTEYGRFAGTVAVLGALVLAPMCLAGEEAEAPQYSPEVQKRLDELRAKGEPVTSADLTLQPIPPEENAATFYRRAEEALVKDDTARSLVREVMAPGAKRGMEDLTGEELKAIRGWVEENRPSLALVRRAGALGNCQFFTNYENMANPGFLVTGYNLAALLQARVLVDVTDGKPQEALEGIRLLLQLADHLAQAETLLAALAEAAYIQNASKWLQEVLSRYGDARSDCDPVMRDIERLLVKNHAPQAIQTERVFVLGQLTDPKQVRKGFLSEDLHLSSYKDPQAELDRALKAHGSLEAWVDKERLAYLDGFEKIQTFSGKQPYQSQGQREAFSKWLSEELPSRVVPAARETLPMYLRYLVMGVGRRWSVLREMVLGIELEQHRTATGSYPEALEGLQLVEPKALPVDPFSGRAFIYHRQGEGYILYSVGTNGKDDGGKRDLEDPEGADDIAWTVGADGGGEGE